MWALYSLLFRHRSVQGCSFSLVTGGISIVQECSRLLSILGVVCRVRTGSVMARVVLLTRGETAVRLRVSVMTVRRLGAAGLITEVQVGKRAVRIDAASVAEHIRASRRSSGVAA